MPGLMGRATLIIKAKFSKFLDRSENPNETLDYSYEEQLRQLQNVKRGVADVTTAKKRLELQYTGINNTELRLRVFMLQGGASTDFGEKANSQRIEFYARYYF